MATKNITADTFTLAAYATVTAVATKNASDVRFYYAQDSNRFWKVQITRRLEVNCLCGTFGTRQRTGEGEICEHAAEAIDFVEELGWKKLPEWNKNVKEMVVA